MEIQTERMQGVLVIALNGRLDGFGAGKLEEALRREVKDDDNAVVLDLELVPYLSSAGIRVFLGLKNELKRRKGMLALASLQDYPRKVLESAGFLTIFGHYSSVEAAVAALQKPAERVSVIEAALTRPVVMMGARFSFGPGTGGPAALRVIGDVRDILFSRITPAKIHEKRFSDIVYSLGLGGLGESVQSVLPILGEMITLHGSMVWQPTDGNNTPDFFTPAKDTGLVTAYAGFNITLDGVFHDIADVETESENGISLADLYRALFRFAKENRKSYHGVIAIAMWAVTAGVASSGLIRSPIEENALPPGESIFDANHIREWVAIDPGPRYSGDTMVSFGVGIDLTMDLSRFDPATLGGLYYIHPANLAQTDMYLHNHGVIFQNIPWDRSLDLDQQIRKIVQEGEFVDMRHLLDTTRIRKAKIGIAYISSVVRDHPE